MKIYQEMTETRTHKSLVERKCDLCGRVGKPEWYAKSTFDVEETAVSIEVRMKTGKEYPEGGHGRKYEVDLCPTCFKERLVPWLQMEGADIHEEDWDV